MTYTTSWFDSKRVTVMGLGRHGGGLGIAKWLLRHGAELTVTDAGKPETLTASIGELEKLSAKLGRPVRFVIGRHEDRDFIETDLVVRNPAVPRDNRFLAIARAHGIPVESDISLLFLLCPHPLTAITGTKGKTTVTTLLHAIAMEHDARAVAGGNIRISPFSWLDRVIKARQAPPIVLELSSWQLEDLEQHHLSPHLGVITNIMPDHLNRYDGMDDYARAKQLAVAFQQPGDVAILNYDDERLRQVGEHGSSVTGATNGGRVMWFGWRRPGQVDGCFVAGGWLKIWDSKKVTPVMPVAEVRLLGRHNLVNAAAAVAAAFAMGIPVSTIRRAIKKFRGVSGRLETVAIVKGVTYVNDTTATMPDAAVAALAALAKKRNVILIAGGADKDLVFEDWAKVVAKTVRQLVLFPGKATDKMLPVLDQAAARVRRVIAKDMKDAVRQAAQFAKRGDVVLLSPGAASFGLFQHEFDRGDQFVRAVKALAKK